MTLRFSSGRLRAGGLRVTACLRSPLTPSSGFGALLRRLRAVAWEVEHLDLGLAPNEPVADLGRAVDRQAVEDEEDLRPGVPDQTSEKAEQVSSR